MTEKTLYLLRHAETAHPAGLRDEERPLTRKGEDDARALGRVMNERGHLPALVLCSPAARTRQTCALLALKAAIAYDKKIYMAGTGDLYEILKKADDGHDSLMLVGHNPGIHGLARFLAGSGDPVFLSGLAAGYAPGSLAVLECGCESWAGFLPGAARLADFLRADGL